MKFREWTTEKPDKPCVLAVRSERIHDDLNYGFNIIKMADWADEPYLAVIDINGAELEAFEDLDADEYFVIDWLDESEDAD